MLGLFYIAGETLSMAPHEMKDPRSLYITEVITLNQTSRH